MLIPPITRITERTKQFHAPAGERQAEIHMARRSRNQNIEQPTSNIHFYS
jgi:hypothetical protein